MDRNPPLARQDLYPPIEPYASGMLRLNAVHTMYWEQSGNPDGKPIVFLHGGPGAGSTATHRRFFDPQYYRIVDFRSARRRPLDAARRARRQHDAASDRRYRALRQFLGIERWAGVRRLLGLDLRARLCRSASRALSLVSCCAASSCAGRARSTGSSMACARCSRRRGVISRAISPEAERNDLLGAYYRRLMRSRSGRPHAGGARLEHL